MSLEVKVRLHGEAIADGKGGILKHQEETLAALMDTPVVFNCAMTGAGKTKAAHLAIRQEAFNEHVLFVAPTNALVYQHVQDAKWYVDQESLPHHVVGIDGAVLARLQRNHPALYRPSEALYQVIYNPRNYAEDLGIQDDKTAAPLWLITNPDQIWLSIVQGRGRDTRNLLQKFINHFRFIVVDEFHYYSAEQLVLFFLCVAFWKTFGQFDDGLKLLFLTATPDEMVETFFNRIGLSHKRVGLQDRDEQGTVPVLAPVELTLTSGNVLDFKKQMLEHYNAGLDGLAISDSLLEINKLYSELGRLGGAKLLVGRITGPIDSWKRKSESQKRLILATPTVDLGYNFIKPKEKERQEIDFLFSTARDRASFWQRLGRTGRVLGRKQTDVPSRATMILPTAGCFEKARSLDGQQITRLQLQTLLNIRSKRLKSYALTREGLYTATHKLSEVERMLSENDKGLVQEIFDSLKACFDPEGLAPDWPSFRKRHWLYSQVEAISEKYPRMNGTDVLNWIQAGREDFSDGPERVVLSSWVKNLYFKKGALNDYLEYINNHGNQEIIRNLLTGRNSSNRQCVINYIREQALRYKYLFNFRGSATGQDVVWVYDPEMIFSPHVTNKIGLITLLAKYEYSGPIAGEEAHKLWRVYFPKSDMVFKLVGFREYPFQPVFYSSDRLPEITDAHCPSEDADCLSVYWRTVALHNLEVHIENKSGRLPVPHELKGKLQDVSELFYITPMENSAALSNWLKEYDVQTGTLKAKDSYSRDKPYSVVFGKDAIMMSEELYYKHRLESC